MSAFIKQHPVLSFYAFAFAISWGAVLLVVGPGGFLATTSTSPRFAPAGFVWLLGPSVSGVLVISLVGGRPGWRDVLSRLRRWRVAPHWYAVALVTAPLVMTMTLLALALTSPAARPAIVTAEDKVSLLLLAIVTGLIVPAFEELGWTGFATPRLLLRHGVLATGLIMGTLWGALHLPLFAGSAGASGPVPPVLFVAAILFLWMVPYRVLMVWVYDRTRSLLLGMLMHAPIVVGAILLEVEAISGEQRFISLIGSAAGYWVVVGAAALANHGHLTRGRPRRQAAQAVTA